MKNLLSISIVLIVFISIGCCKNKKKAREASTEKKSEEVVKKEEKTQVKSLSGIKWIESFDEIENKTSVKIKSASIKNTQLTMVVNYSGGCKDHSFELFYNNVVENENANLFLAHNGNNDLCKGYVTDTLNFDITRLMKDDIVLNTLTLLPTKLLVKMN